MTFWIAADFGRKRYVTAFVKEMNGIIIDTAPVWHKFKGQPLTALLRWLESKGNYKIEELR